jgi:hypothetical protein
VRLKYFFKLPISEMVCGDRTQEDSPGYPAKPSARTAPKIIFQIFSFFVKGFENAADNQNKAGWG